MDGACGAHRGGEKPVQNFGRKTTLALYVDGRRVLKCILVKVRW
jgi:hypothetical protein